MREEEPKTMNDTENPTPAPEPKKVMRPQEGRMIAGVCAGMAKYFEMDPTLIRVAAVLFTCLGGSGILAYLICWLVIPEETA